MNERVYRRLKLANTILLPAVAALYATLSELWRLPAPMEVAGTISAVVAFANIALQMASDKYWGDVTTGGDMIFTDIGDGLVKPNVVFSQELEELAGSNKIIFNSLNAALEESHEG